MADDSIGAYYRHLYEMEYPYRNGEPSGKLTRPVWGTHCSCIRGKSERIKNDHLWGLDADKLIDFEYEPGVKSNGEYSWLEVKSLYLENLRYQYGLSKQPRFGFHLTIGREAQ